MPFGDHELHELHVSSLRSHGEVPLHGVTVTEPAQERPPEARHHRCLCSIQIHGVVFPTHPSLSVPSGASTTDPAVVCYRSETTSRRIFRLVGAGLLLDGR